MPTVAQVHGAASSLGTSFELVLVLNGCEHAVVDQARELCQRLPNIQVYVLRGSSDLASATALGLENAVGDWVVTLDLDLDEPKVVADLFQVCLDRQAELVLGVPTERRVDRTFLDAVLATGFHRVFRWIHGYSLAEQSPTARLFARSFVNEVLRSPNPLVALQTLTVRGGYRKELVSTAARPGKSLPLVERVRNRWQLLLGINSMPLRLANLLCAAGAGMSVLYSLYVVAIYLFKTDVMPGWTTVSLMLAGMFFLISIVLSLISEYLILLLEGSSRRPRYETAEEFASQVETRRRQLNVEVEL